MPKKKNYPKWFSPYGKPYKPHKPTEPKEYIPKYVTLKTIEVSVYDSFIKEEFLDLLNSHECDRVQFECEQYMDETPEILMHLQCSKEIKNPNYQSQLGFYEKALVKYREDYEDWKQKNKEWKELKEKWDAEAAEENRKKELKELERLRKKYEIE